MKKKKKKRKLAQEPETAIPGFGSLGLRAQE